jgi:hypothetical protein
MTGNFTVREKDYPFSICDGAAVYFDTDGNGGIERSQVSGAFSLSSDIGMLNFTLKYVSTQNIKVRFDQTYMFSDFAKSPAVAEIKPVDGNYDRVLLAAGATMSAVVMNGTKQVQTAWVADFSRDAEKMGDDHKNLLLSLILALSNKKAFSVLSPNVKIGFVTSYINVNATDLYEILRLNLGLGYPY